MIVLLALISCVASKNVEDLVPVGPCDPKGGPHYQTCYYSDLEPYEEGDFPNVMIISADHGDDYEKYMYDGELYKFYQDSEMGRLLEDNYVCDDLSCVISIGLMPCAEEEDCYFYVDYGGNCPYQFGQYTMNSQWDCVFDAEYNY